ncbi:MAG: HigA family addiction module antidote protein [Rhodospirillaceae bacterium]|nr:HigA family addiction module antidote protein [Rhodospirillaceae bacterium]MYF86716.1 HigA family addiction module antidote protein [Rhodospirillaceae bacterium]MYH37419.1 HigA family addiction module antidote protein [Rhodospirillaceae bacterium]MYK13839.1 HigA family addiction module antidote protein [Rhodospirillaceae bacterium]MYK58928.1 HigA family addiction module antidote protein [Rhodospirillaceae bacterium]
MAMKNPVHPGAIVREDCLKPLGLSVTEGAKRLGVGRQTLSNLVNEKAAVSIEMAYRLSKAFGSTPETWLGMQLAFHLSRSRDLERSIKIERIAPA